MRALLIALPFLVAGCSDSVTAAGPAESRRYEASGFHAVDLRGAENVNVTVGPAFAVSATGPRRILDALEIRVEDGTLRVARKRGISGTMEFGSATVAVSMPALDGVAIHGAGDIHVDKVEGPRFAATLDGAGDIDIAALKGGAVTLALGGSGNLHVSGQAETLNASLKGAGSIDASGLHAAQAEIALGGMGNIDAHVTRAATVALRGMGDVRIKGGARCTIARSGLGDVSCS
jgi:hypothetical protein